MADDCRSIDTPTILLGEDGEIILVYLPDFLTHENVDKTMAAVDSLLAEVQLTSPKKDCRHKGINMADLKDKYGPGKFGTLHCAALFNSRLLLSEAAFQSLTLAIICVRHGHILALSRILTAVLEKSQPAPQGRLLRHWNSRLCQ